MGDYNLLFAEKQDEEELRGILWEYGMDIAGEIEHHLIIKENDQVIAGAKIIEVEPGNFHLEVIGVRPDKKGMGYGSILLGEIVRNPWKCSKVLLTSWDSGIPYIITTLSRGKAEGFYKKLGFEPCEFERLPKLNQHQCSDCPDIETCNPVPMIFSQREVN